MKTANFPIVTILCFPLSLLFRPTLCHSLQPLARINPSPQLCHYSPSTPAAPPPHFHSPELPPKEPLDCRIPATCGCGSSDLLRMCLPLSLLKMDTCRGFFSCASVDGDDLMALFREGSTRTGQWRKPLKLTFQPLQKFDLFHQKPPDAML